MKKSNLFIGLGIIVLIIGSVLLICNNMRDAKEDTIIVINIHPLDGIKDVNGVVEDFTNLYLKAFGIDSCKVNILPHKNSPECAYNASHTRYRAIKLVNYLHENTEAKEFTIGITDKDISTSIHGSDDYGILGLAFRGNAKRACIASTYRLKYRKDLWKLLAHEFTHGFFDIGHCEMDDSHCIMQDAKGKSPKFENKRYFCTECAYKIDKKLHSSFY